MTIYRIHDESLEELPQTTFASAGITERGDLQRFLRDRIEVVAPDTLVISEEFCYWEDSRRRIDLLAIDKDANLVVVELTRTEDGGHMELQAIRYAAMVSTLTFAKAVDIFSDYLKHRDDDRNAEEVLIEFLEWDEPDEDAFASDVRIVLASAEFSKELTSAVLWLSERGVDIRCVRIRPYGTLGSVLLDVQQVIPLPEAEDYQVRVREKKQQERTTRKYNPDLTKFNVTIGGQTFERLPKRRALHAIVKGLCDSGVSPSQIGEVLDWRSTLFYSAGGNLTSERICAQLEAEGIGRYSPRRWFTETEELIHFDAKTYTLSNQWGANTAKAMKQLVDHFQPQDISFEKAMK